MRIRLGLWNWRGNNSALGLRHGIRRVGAILLALAGALSVLAQEPAEILIRNGLVVTETGRLQADVRIRGAEIAEIAATSRRRAAREPSTPPASWCCRGASIPTCT